jgi:hypothetical protein
MSVLVGWRAFFMWCADGIRPGSTVTRTELFDTQEEARKNVELSRSVWRDKSNFVGCVASVYHELLTVEPQGELNYGNATQQG